MPDLTLLLGYVDTNMLVKLKSLVTLVKNNHILCIWIDFALSSTL